MEGVSFHELQVGDNIWFKVHIPHLATGDCREP